MTSNPPPKWNRTHLREACSSSAYANFTVADIVFTCVLREIRKTEILSKYSHIEKYRYRCEERPAFVKVLNAYEDRLGIARGNAR